jgi:hypothetical protein
MAVLVIFGSPCLPVFVRQCPCIWHRLPLRIPASSSILETTRISARLSQFVVPTAVAAVGFSANRGVSRHCSGMA